MPASALAFAPTLAVVDGKPTTLSTDVARAFGKRHDDVLRSIRNLLPQLDAEHARNFAETHVDVEIAGARNFADTSRKSPAYRLTRDGFTLLAMGFTGKKALQFKLAYIDAFNQMEAALQAQRTPSAGQPGFYKALEASNALSSAVQVAAMQALMEGGELKAGRWFMNINEHEGPGKGIFIKPMPLNAIMAAPEDWARLIAEPNGNYFSKETLTLIMHACLNKLLDYLDCAQQSNEMLRTELKRRKALPALKGGQA